MTTAWAYAALFSHCGLNRENIATYIHYIKTPLEYCSIGRRGSCLVPTSKPYARVKGEKLLLSSDDGFRLCSSLPSLCTEISRCSLKSPQKVVPKKKHTWTCTRMQLLGFHTSSNRISTFTNPSTSSTMVDHLRMMRGRSEVVVRRAVRNKRWTWWAILGYMTFRVSNVFISAQHEHTMQQQYATVTQHAAWRRVILRSTGLMRIPYSSLVIHITATAIILRP